MIARALLLTSLFAALLPGQKEQGVEPGPERVEQRDPIEQWIDQLAEKDERKQALMHLRRAGDEALPALVARIETGWPDADSKQAHRAHDALVTLLLRSEQTLPLDLARLFELYDWDRSLEADQHRGLNNLREVIERVIAQDPKQALPILQQRMATRRFAYHEEEMFAHATWAQHADLEDYVERLRDAPREQRRLAFDLLPSRLDALLAERPDQESALREQLLFYGERRHPIALQLLRRLGNRDARTSTAYLEDLKGLDPALRHQALEELRDFDSLPSAVTAQLVLLLASPEPPTVRSAAELLVQALDHTPGVFGILEDQSRGHPDPEIRALFENALAARRTDDSLPELATYWYPDGRLSAEGAMIDGHKHGDWQYLWPHGSTRSVGEYAHGKEQGLWFFFHPDRRPSAEGAYEDGEETGRWRTWYANGGPSSDGHYDAGRAVGSWQGWHENGKPAWKGTFTEGARDEVWTFWHPDGQLKARGEYRRGQRVGTWRLLTESGAPLPADWDVAAFLGEG